MHLLRKELGELITKQMLLGLAAMFLVIVMIGLVMTSAVSDTILTGGELSIIDLDETAFTEKLIAALEDDGYTVRVEKPGADTTDFASIMEKNGWKEAAVITNGFTSQLLEEQVAGDLYTVSVLSSTSALNAVSMSESSADIAAAKIRSLLMEEALGSDAQRLSKPAQITPYTVANGKQAQADSYVLVNSLSLFDRLMPLVLFMLVMLTSQTIITALAAEKTDKTLEALLSSPVPRSSVLIAKMLAALIVAVLYALVYGIGFGIAMMMTVSGTGDSMDLSSALTDMAQTNEAMITLGLQIDAMGWVMTVLHLILTICISLVASLVLGALIQDAKGAQTASLPILFTTMAPYILSMVSDIRQLELPVRVLLYLIPFTHTFTATSCLRFHEMGLFWGGLAYQAVFLAVLSLIALKLYRSDILFIGYQFKRKKR